MAVQQSRRKREIELHTAPGNRTAHYCPVLVAVALAGFTTLSVAGSNSHNQARLPSRQVQSGTPSPAMQRSPATHSPTTPAPHTGSAPRQTPVASQGKTPQGAPHGTPDSPALGHRGSPTLSNQGNAGSPTQGQHGTADSRATDLHNTRAEHQLSNGHRVLETTRATSGGGRVHAVRYGNALTGVVEHPTKPGYLSRTYVQGGRVLYARVYRQNTFQRFGRAFSYESLVPAVAFGAAYYSWAARPWATPVNYNWRWDTEPWHAAYGGSFTPYSSYSSLDEWITDYVVSQNLKSSYAEWQAENSPTNGVGVGQAQSAAGATPSQAGAGTASRQSSDPAARSEPGQRPDWEAPDDRRPYWEESSNDGQGQSDGQAQPGAHVRAQPVTHAQPDPSVQAKRAKTPSPSPNSGTGSQDGAPADTSPPPLSGEIKAELNAQIKQRLIERQNQETTSDKDTLPDSLKPGHTLFRVSTPLDVASNVSGRVCSLRANDYIERTGDMDENGTVPVKVKLGGTADCGIGIKTRVSVNDLEAMESEQQQALTDALLAASKNMGDRGLPQAPGTTPILLAGGQARPAPDATTTLSQLQ
jgi:hypothetical protein